MTTTIAPPRVASLPGRSSAGGGVQAHRHRAVAPLTGSAPWCSLKARPVAQPAPAPSWEELLGQR